MQFAIHDLRLRQLGWSQLGCVLSIYVCIYKYSSQVFVLSQIWKHPMFKGGHSQKKKIYNERYILDKQYYKYYISYRLFMGIHVVGLFKSIKCEASRNLSEPTYLHRQLASNISFCLLWFVPLDNFLYYENVTITGEELQTRQSWFFRFFMLLCYFKVLQELFTPVAERLAVRQSLPVLTNTHARRFVSVKDQTFCMS